jgi:hypothetical protein
MADSQPRYRRVTWSDQPSLLNAVHEVDLQFVFLDQPLLFSFMILLSMVFLQSSMKDAKALLMRGWKFVTALNFEIPKGLTN